MNSTFPVTLNLAASTPRIFAAGHRANLATHAQTFGQLPTPNPQALLQQIELSGLDGRGGAGFSTFRKLASTEQGKKATIIANGAEGEYLSYKDRMILEHAPHLVMDGLQLAASIIGARQLVIYARAESLAHLAAPAAERGITLLEAPGTFVSGEASAAARTLLEGISKPLHHIERLNRSEKTGSGILGRSDRGPILVQNVETLAQLALIARYGGADFVAAGTRIFTLHNRTTGAAQVIEAADGTPLETLCTLAGINLSSAPAVLLGGFQGQWVQPANYRQEVGAQGLKAAAGIIYPLAAAENQLVETARILTYLAGQNAGQCGPCVNGLPELAAAFQQLVAGKASVENEIKRLSALVTGRGICSHPDATATFALHTLAQAKTAPISAAA